jgi:predicted ATPase
VRPAFLETVYTLTDGNPFFVEEVLKSLLEAGVESHVDGSWDRTPLGDVRIPRSVHDAVGRRVERVSAASRRVLTNISTSDAYQA